MTLPYVLSTSIILVAWHYYNMDTDLYTWEYGRLDGYQLGIHQTDRHSLLQGSCWSDFFTLTWSELWSQLDQWLLCNTTCIVWYTTEILQGQEEFVCHSSTGSDDTTLISTVLNDTSQRSHWCLCQVPDLDPQLQSQSTSSLSFAGGYCNWTIHHSHWSG